MNGIMNAIEPYIVSVVVALVGLLATAALTGINALKAKVSTLLDARLSESQIALLHAIASEAYAYAEAEFKAADGSAKLTAATQYALDKLAGYGATISLTEIQSAIHKAWIDVGGNVK